MVTAVIYQRRLRLLAVLVVVLLLAATLLSRSPDDKALAGPWMGQARQSFIKELDQVRVLAMAQKGLAVTWQGHSIAINEDGWPVPPCDGLWQDFGLPPSLGGDEVQISWQGDFCRFAVEEDGFDYWPHSGRVEAFKQGEGQ
ncbi:hypothetical protein [Gallaecimonas pentaromativorans]|uniref:hypothetical protein n=1 Tax=Gallaecimonas pentaromativorans TaxID=584787 RepID=UPI003A8E286A